ncbi:TonB-dependent receptor [Paludibacter sp.]|uniref:SusC/RagA family TonB-linked outer membrane protein n=1 Tax=Paludibacter sp. TaxID=1898105 RepID=UPI00135376E4|nr:TonB-dependent receptor [Paludibacter sp.]MTK52992.1 TonB-dependent receptor [Paludibacter sp.]
MNHQKFRLTGIATLLCMLLISTGIIAQNPSPVSGVVVDQKGEALIGVSIMIKGTSTGTITNVDGKFTLPATNIKNPVLLVSYVGYNPQEVAAKGSSIKIVMAESSKALEEIVVVGYGSQRKKDLTGSVSVVKTEDLSSLPVPSVSDAMQGRAAGVQVISSGTPGSDATFRIRGTGTINDSNPLFVIDGLPVSSGLNQLNMDDIESLQILKDASATAIYGSRGANGVVIITTKKGKGDKSHINFNYSFGLQEATHTIKMLNASQFATLHNEMMTNAGLAKNPEYSSPESLGAGTDWLDALFGTAPMHNYSFSYSGNSDKSSYYVSGNYLKQDGIVTNTGYSRYTFQLNTESKVLPVLKFGNNLTLNHDIKSSGNYSIKNTMLALPTQPIYRSNGNYSGPVAQPMWDGDIVNPIGLAKTVDNSTLGYNVMGSVFGELEIMKYLKLKSNFGLQANFWNSRSWAPKYAWDTSINSNSYLSEQYNKNLTWTWDNTLTFDKSFGLHRIGIMAGTSAQKNRYNYMNGSIQTFASDLTQQLSNGTLQPTIGGSTSSWALFSEMGRFNYAYNDKYLVTATIRRDGSSRFGSNNKYGIFPSVSLAWRASQEDFFKNISFINDLKIRAGYGITGNQEIGNYSFASSLNTIKYNFNNTVVSAVVPTVMPNPNVQWEQQKQANAGFDATLFNQRVDISLDAYIKRTDKMLVPMVVPVSTGYSDVYVPSINAGKMDNRGVEVTVNTKNLTGKLKWNSSFNFSYNQNKVVSINDTVPMSSGSIGLNYNLALIKAGQPINEFYGFKTDGIFQNQKEVDNHALQVPGNDPYNRTSPGDIRFKDLNHDGVINDQDRTYLGSPNPKFIFAMNNTFSYGGFDLSIFMQGVAGNKICNANRFWSEAMDVAQNQTTETLKRWTGEGTITSMPRAVYNDPNKNTRPSDRYIEDGSYVRIKNVKLGYTLPTQTLKKIYLTNLRFYVSIENLCTFTKYTGFDPEVGASGIDNNVYPVTRTYSIGVNIGL